MSGWGDILYLFGENEKLRTHVAECEALCDRLADELRHYDEYVGSSALAEYDAHRATEHSEP